MDCPNSIFCPWELDSPTSDCRTYAAHFAPWSCGTAAG